MPEEYQVKKILVDLDGTVLGFGDYHGMSVFGGPVPGVECFLSVAYALGHRMLLWTTRPRGKARPYLKLVKDSGLRGWPLARYFDDINQVPPKWKPEDVPMGPKPYYDLSLDDRTMNGHLLVTDKMPAQFTPLTWGLATMRLLQDVKSMDWRGHQEVHWLQNINAALTRLTKIIKRYHRYGRRDSVMHYKVEKSKNIIDGHALIDFDDSGLNGWLRYTGLRGFLKTQHTRIKKEIRRVSEDT